MKSALNFLPLVTIVFLQGVSYSAEISAVPGPDDQGGMIMPMVTIMATEGPASNPTAGSVNVDFNPANVPVLKSLNEWNPNANSNDWFAETAAWRSDISPIDGSIPGMPSANAGNGDLFNNQHGFMFMSMSMPGMANVPEGNSLAIRLSALSSPDLKSFNYGNAANRWDQVFDTVDSQVLWNGTMWHNYFTMPANTAPGTYTAEFEIFIADVPFTGSTGFAQYDSAALSASRNANFESAFVTYDFSVVPEPASAALLIGLLSMGYVARRRRL